MELPAAGANEPDAVGLWTERLVRHARDGSQLNLAGEGAAPDPASADGWPEERTVPAAAIRAALLELQRNPDTADPHGLRLTGADILGRLDLENTRPPCPLKLTRCRLTEGLDLDGAQLPDLSLKGCLLHGDAEDGEPVRAIGATITGQLDLSGATLTNQDGIALGLDRASIGGDVFLHEGFTATGQVRALGATITGNLDLSGATLTNHGGTALHLDEASIGGGVFLKGFTATGQVRALGATITGNLDLSGATLNNHDGIALYLQGSRVGLLWLRGLKQVRGVVDLTSCEIGDLALDAARRVPPGALAAVGWRVRSVHGAMAADARLAKGWLDTRPAHVPYSPQPARALAEVYERSGHPDEARRLRHAAARQLARQAPRRAKPRHYAYGLLVGHGYRPLRPLLWILVLFAVTLGLTEFRADQFVPTEPVKAAEAAEAAASANPGQPVPDELTGTTPCPALGDYPCFTPWSYALQTVVPPAAAVQSTAWQPTGWLLVGITVLKAAGWILVALLLAGVTGLLRRT